MSDAQLVVVLLEKIIYVLVAMSEMFRTIQLDRLSTFKYLGRGESSGVAWPRGEMPLPRYTE